MPRSPKENDMPRLAPSSALLLALAFSLAFPAGAAESAGARALAPELIAFYEDLHRHPELSLHEGQTAAKLAERLRALGFEVATGVGGTGVVGVLKNGSGKVVLLRTELDALPVEEKTGLPYASVAHTKNDLGVEVPVMHACGHDVHMTAWVGTAEAMAHDRSHWHGTLVFIAQPAEEIGAGARAMLAAGLLTRFPKPDFAVAFHDTPNLPSGQVGFTSGTVMAGANSVDITIFGKGGHGAAPQTTVDPIVIAARTIVALQTIVAREIDPLDPAVITVGSIHGGTKHNIVPDEVKLQLTVRSLRTPVRDHLLAAIERIARAEAAAANAPRPPEVKVTEGISPTYNDPALISRATAALRQALGAGNVIERQPEMISEDFGEFGRAGIPAVLLRLGAAEPGRLAAATAKGETLPSLHSSQFAPDRDATIATGIAAETAILRDLLGP
jgi:amidohydrolase